MAGAKSGISGLPRQEEIMCSCHTFLPWSCPVPNAVMSCTKTLNFKRVFFVTSLNASCNTVRKSKHIHWDPGKMAVMVVSGSAAHPSNCTRLCCSKIPTKHPQDLSWEAELRRPSPDHKEADSLKGLHQVQDQGHSSLFFCLCSSIKSFHFHQ